jgi:hypothetical protein
MLIETAAGLAPRDELEIDLPESGATRAIVVWNSGAFFGCEFVEPLSRATLSAALLRSLPANVPQLPLPLETGETDEPIADSAEKYPAAEGKAPLPARLRVIFGGAILLWALIIWAAISLVRILR